MRQSKLDFITLISSGDYYVLQKKDDRNREDIAVKREDGLPADIVNYPYRNNQMPAYIFDEFLEEGVIAEAGKAECGGTIFRVTDKMRKRASRAA